MTGVIHNEDLEKLAQGEGNDDDKERGDEEQNEERVREVPT